MRESDRRENRKHNKKREDDELCDHEWRLGLRRSHRFQPRRLLEGLYDSDEDIEIEGDRRAHYIDPTPGAGEVKGVACNESKCQNQQRQTPT